MKTWGEWIGSAACTAALLVSCSAPDDRPPPLGADEVPEDRLPATTARYRKTSCPMEEPLDITVECGLVTVPENHAEPDGPEIELAVARFFSNAAHPSPVPVVYLEGGPGAAALDSVSGSFSSFRHLLEYRDLVAFDQRGTGRSNPRLACPELDALTVAVGDPDQTDVLGPLQRCRDRLIDEGIALDHYNSRQNAADVDAVRLALGYPEWDLYGISYGTRLALTTLRDHPDGVRRAVIDSVVPLEVDLFSGIAASAERSFSLVFDYCAKDSSCGATYPDPMSQLVRAVAELEATPADLVLSDGAPLALTGDLVLNVLFLLLYDALSIPFLPALVEMTAGRDYTLYEALFTGLSEESIVSLGMYLSVNCTEEVPFTSRAAMDVAASSVGAPFDSLADPIVFDECAIWNVQPAAPVENEPVRSAIPTLVLSGELDPITPPSYGDLVATNLSASQYLVLPGQSHGASLSPCGAELVDRFLEDPTAIVAPTCIGGLGPPEFELRSRRQATGFATSPPSRAELQAMVDRLHAGWR
jgi:pimeloyl-ACP methyl ester carboxylesterase